MKRVLHFRYKEEQQCIVPVIVPVNKGKHRAKLIEYAFENGYIEEEPEND